MHSARYLLFISAWSTLIYIPMARWSWYSDGWIRQLGSMDFAGGTPVHIAAGSAVAAMSLFYSFESNGYKEAVTYLKEQTKRRARNSIPWALATLLRRFLFGKKKKARTNAEDREPNPEEPNSTEQPTSADHKDLDAHVYSVNMAVIGTALLWVGWFGFNGGSALGANNRAVSACLSTHVAACSGGVTAVFLHWVLKRLAKAKDINYKPHEFRRLTAIQFCDGVLAGLVAITPGSGYVGLILSPRCLQVSGYPRKLGNAYYIRCP